MKLPVESLLLILGFLSRQTLGRVLVANRRLSGVVNRHRKTLNLPEIPVPPRLSTRLKLLAFLAVVTLLLLPVGIAYARRSTRSRLRAAGLVPERLHEVQRFLRVYDEHPVACRRTCDSSQLRCHAECDFKYTLRDVSGGTITKRNCSSTGFPTTNASPSIVGWNCSFDYAVNEATIDIGESEVRFFEWLIATLMNVLLAIVASADAMKFLRRDRRIADKYMAATSGPCRDRVLRKHEKLRKGFIRVSVAAFVLAGLYGI
ncbi:hypothetical protein AAVH_43814, partial [Aphelenchoides avenae]